MTALASQSGAVLYLDAFNEGIRPDPEMTVSEWADAYRYLPRKSSSEPGKYRTARAPYLREIMDVLSPTDPTEDISVMKGTQLGLTEVGNNLFGYVADMCPGPMMMVFPTVELAKGHSQQKLVPTIEDTPRLRGKVSEARSRDSKNTILAKDFPGGALFLTGSNSAAALRHKTIRFLVLDDLDGFEHKVGDEGDPSDIAEKRTDTYGSRKKIYRNGSPTTKGASRIAKHYEASDQRRYHVPCPHCGEMQTLEFGKETDDFGIKFTRNADGDVISAAYQCRHCHELIDEHHKTWMLAHGQWRAEHPGRRKRGYQISSLYSPLGWVSWRQIAQEFIEAKNDKEKLKVWINTRMGLAFEEKGDQPSWVLLKARCEPYRMLTIPEGVQLLSASVDVHPNRLEVKIKGWGYGEESWLIFRGKIFGDTERRAAWDQLDGILNRSFAHPDGHELRIATMAVDSGNQTQTVYNYCRFRKPRVIAIKGSSKPNKPIIGRPALVDVNYKGLTIKGGVQLWPVGTDSAKSTIYGRLDIKEVGPGYCHFPEDLEDDYFVELTAEKLVTKFDSKGFPHSEWVKVEERNESLDLEVYAYAAAIRSGLPYMEFLKPTRSADKKPKEKTAMPQRRSGFVNRWKQGRLG